MSKHREHTKKFLPHFWAFGSSLAIVISFTKYHNILLAIFHGILSWFYVIFYAIFKI